MIKYEPVSREAWELSELTAEILRPRDPANAKFKSAREILEGILEIEAAVGWGNAEGVRGRRCRGRRRGDAEGSVKLAGEEVLRGEAAVGGDFFDGGALAV